MNRLDAKKAIITILTIIYLVPTAGHAFGGPREGGRHQGPPPEAFEACENKEFGDKVQLTIPSGETITAVCRDMDGQLLAVPIEGRHQGPPPEAFEACENKEFDDKVQLTTPSGETITATCRDMDGQLLAVPAGGRGKKGRQGGPADGQ